MPSLELTIVMPCLNEANTIMTCIGKAQWFLEQNQIAGEILIADNGSTDASPDIALRMGAKVIHVPNPGYGAALKAGIRAAQGHLIIMADSDDTYNFLNLTSFIEALRQGNDLVIGNRFRGVIESGAMPILHQYLGNPVISLVGRTISGVTVGDYYCGLRGFWRKKLLALNLQMDGFEFALEMILRAGQMGLRIAEVPTRLSISGRSHPPHLRTWRDGYRSILFLLKHAMRSSPYLNSSGSKTHSSPDIKSKYY